MKIIILVLTLWGSNGLSHGSSEYDSQEPWRCESLGRGIYVELSHITTSEYLQPEKDQYFWTIYWDGHTYEFKSVLKAVGNSMFDQGAILLRDSVQDGYDSNGNYYVYGNYNIQGTICSLMITDNRQISLLYDRSLN